MHSNTNSSHGENKIFDTSALPNAKSLGRTPAPPGEHSLRGKASNMTLNLYNPSVEGRVREVNKTRNNCSNHTKLTKII